MFDDARLARALAAEEKGGLVLSFDGEQMTAIGRDWLALIPQDMLSREYRQTLGHLVEVLGYVPDVETLEIRRGKGEYIVERPLPEVVANQAASFVGTPGGEVQWTGLRRHINQLYQTRRGRIYGCAMNGPALESQSGVRLTDAVTLRWCDENSGEEVYRRAERPREDTHTEEELSAWAHLEAFDWCRWDDPGREEIEGQTKMEE